MNKLQLLQEYRWCQHLCHPLVIYMKSMGRDWKVGCRAAWKISLVPTVWVILKPLVSLLSHWRCVEDCLSCSSPTPTVGVIAQARTLLGLTPQHLHLEPLLVSTHTVHWNLQGLYKAYSTFSTSKESFCCRTGTFTAPFHYIKGTVLRIFAICAKDFLLVCLLGVKQTTYFYMALKTSLKAPENQLQRAAFCYQQQNRGRLQHLWFYLEQLCLGQLLQLLVDKHRNLICLFKFSSAVQKELVHHLMVTHIKEVCSSERNSSPRRVLSPAHPTGCMASREHPCHSCEVFSFGMDTPRVIIHNAAVHVLFILWLNSQTRLGIILVRNKTTPWWAPISSV